MIFCATLEINFICLRSVIFSISIKCYIYQVHENNIFLFISYKTVKSVKVNTYLQFDFSFTDALPDIIHNWTVQRQSEYGFSSVACDQTIEQTFNRESKTKGGVTGITLNRPALNRWILSQSQRVAIAKQCKVMAGLEKKTRLFNDLLLY